MKLCPKCNTLHNKSGIFCSRSCANSRFFSEESRYKKSIALKGKSYSTKESVRKGLLKKGQIPSFDKPNTKCKVCNKDTGTKHRKTCSIVCYKLNAKLLSQSNEKCGGQKHTNRSKISNIKGDFFIAESSYEVLLSIILNNLNIEWVRPKFVWYTDKSGNKRRYYPDFYLPNYELYIDTKNDYLIKTDIDKIIKASSENEIFIVILGIKFLNKEKIKELVGDRGSAPLLPACKAGTLLLC